MHTDAGLHHRTSTVAVLCSKRLLPPSNTQPGLLLTCLTVGVQTANAASALLADGMHEKLEDVAWIEEQPWRESLVITSAQPTHVEDVDDDLERELAFYNQVGTPTPCSLSAWYHVEDPSSFLHQSSSHTVTNHHNSALPKRLCSKEKANDAL